jgi:putative membrane protein
MLNMLIAWLINAGALLALPYILQGVQISGFTTALIAAAVLGFLNVLIKPIFFVLTLPISVITLGLFTFVLNGFMFWIAARFIDGFNVTSFWWAVAGAVVYSLITWAVNSLLLNKTVKKTET